jgi:hypothetical protein
LPRREASPAWNGPLELTANGGFTSEMSTNVRFAPIVLKKSVFADD